MGTKKQVRVKMTCYATVTIDEDMVGNQVIEYVNGIEDIEEFEVVD